MTVVVLITPAYISYYSTLAPEYGRHKSSKVGNIIAMPINEIIIK